MKPAGLQRYCRRLAIAATGLQALEDLHHKLRAKGKHLILSAPHAQPPAAMENAGFIGRIGRENACPHIAAARARTREILGLPPFVETWEAREALPAEKREREAARRDLPAVLERTNRALNRSKTPTPAANMKNDEVPNRVPLRYAGLRCDRVGGTSAVDAKKIETPKFGSYRFRQ